MASSVRISQDGTILHGQYAFPPHFIDLTTGKVVSGERMVSGIPTNKKDFMVLTDSQWGHYGRGTQASTGVFHDMRSEREWLGVSYHERSKKIFWAIVDPTSRKDPPNRQVSFFPLPQEWSVNGLIAPAFGAFTHRFRGNSIEFGGIVGQRGGGKNELIFRRLVGWNGVPRVTRRVTIPGTNRKIGPLAYDTKFDEVLYLGEPRSFREWSVAHRKWAMIDSSTWGERWPMYWRGQMLIAPSRGANSDAPKLGLVARDRKSVQDIGPYSWWASSSDQRYALVRQNQQGTYWLLDFGSPSW